MTVTNQTVLHVKHFNDQGNEVSYNDIGVTLAKFQTICPSINGIF